MSEILDGKTTDIKSPSMDFIEDYYKSIWSQPAINDALISSVKTINNDSIFAPIIFDEVRLTIMNKKRIQQLDLTLIH